MKSILFTLTLAFISIASRGQYTLTVAVDGIKNNKGIIAIELLDENKESLKGAKVQIKELKSEYVFTNLKPGIYAVQVFHDENRNDTLDKNMLGIPKEGFGFSENGMGAFGPRNYEEWLFVVTKNKNIVISLKYY